MFSSFWLLVGSLVLIAAGLFSWARAVHAFLTEPNYGSFDMTTASAFDAKWLPGSILLAAGAGLIVGSVWFGIAVFVAGFALNMAVKPPLTRWAARRAAKASPPAPAPRKGFNALRDAERRLEDKKIPTMTRHPIKHHV